MIEKFFCHVNVKNIAVTYYYKNLVLEVDADPNRTWCPSKDCEEICEIVQSKTDDSATAYCTSCNLQFCSKCRAEWHPGEPCQINR